MDAEYLESVLTLGPVSGAETYSEVTDQQLRDYLESKAMESRETVIEDMLDKLVARELYMDMSDRSAKSRMEGLFVSYFTLLRQHGLKWVLENSQKVAVYNIVSAVKTSTVRRRLESDLDLKVNHIHKDLKDFMKHALKLFEAFAMLENGS